MLKSFRDKSQAEKYLAKAYVDNHDRNADCTLHVDARLTDLVRDNITEPISAKNASRLAMLINYRNVAYTTTIDMAEILDISKKNLARIVNALDVGGLMISIATNGIKKPDRVLVFNPSLFWRGSYKLKNKVEEMVFGGEAWQTLIIADTPKMADNKKEKCSFDKATGEIRDIDEFSKLYE